MTDILKVIQSICRCYEPQSDTREEVVDYVCETLDYLFEDIKYNRTFIETVVKQYVKKVYEIDTSKKITLVPDFETIEEKDNYFDFLIDHIDVPSEYKSRWDQYKYLANLPQPVQRSQEWFDMRNNMITASAGAQAIGESKYDKEDNLVLDKIGHGKKFGENKFVHHGKKYEKIATMIYEHVYNVKVGEFGLVPHQASRVVDDSLKDASGNSVHIDFIGASPDGICTNSTLDGKFSPLIGRMLEIKCPLSREIKTEGNEDGDICPHYYWVQVQLQLECCDLEDCDFWQCNLKEYDNFTEWESNTSHFESKYTVEQNNAINFDNLFKRGMVLQFLPKKHDLGQYEKMEWYSKYVYPPRLNMSVEEYKAWSQNMIENYGKYYPDIARDYYFDKILYWKLESSHNYTIKRDRKWFANALPKLKNFWDRVVLLRNNADKKIEFLNKMAPKPVVSKKNNQNDTFLFID